MVRDAILDINTFLITSKNNVVFRSSMVERGFYNPKARGSKSCPRQHFFSPLNII